MDMNFKNKTAMITGGASGIGLLCGQNLARLGANVVLIDINPDTLNAEVDKLCAEGGSCIGAVTDVRDYNQVIAARDKAVATFGTIDIMINCAGGSETRIHNCSSEFKDIPIEVIDWGIDVNLKGAMYFSHAVLTPMAKQSSGVIINLGSVTGEEGSEQNIAYSTSKSAIMNGLTKSLALYGAQYNVRACCVSPGPVLTRAAMACMSTLLDRAADVQEIVDLILYLASDKAAFITGTNYLIDGGRSIQFVKGWDSSKLKED